MLQRTFSFDDFLGAMAFVGRIADLAEEHHHHPDIMIRYSKVTLTISTHDADGLTDKDFELARDTDAIVAVGPGKATNLPSIPDDAGSQGAHVVRVEGVPGPDTEMSRLHLEEELVDDVGIDVREPLQVNRQADPAQELHRLLGAEQARGAQHRERPLDAVVQEDRVLLREEQRRAWCSYSMIRGMIFSPSSARRSPSAGPSVTWLLIW